jgi:hypothetical protein
LGLTRELGNEWGVRGPAACRPILLDLDLERRKKIAAAGRKLHSAAAMRVDGAADESAASGVRRLSNRVANGIEVVAGVGVVRVVGELSETSQGMRSVVPVSFNGLLKTVVKGAVFLPGALIF